MIRSMGDTRLGIVFMGTPDFAVPSLRALAPRHRLLAVVTQPDRPKGRGQALAPSPVKAAALELGVPVLAPEKLRTREAREELERFGADLFVVAAYGKILSAKLLAVPRLGCINVHASLLPAYRGAAPIHWAVIRGEARSGITIMQMDEGMDTGPILFAEGIDLRADETTGSLHDRLAPLGAELLLRAIDGLLDGSVAPRPQPAEGVSMAPMLSKVDGVVSFAASAVEVDRRIRGLDPWPGASTTLAGAPLKLFASRLAPGQGGGRPGEVLGADRRGLLVACGEGEAIFVAELQLAGKKRMAATALVAGHPIPAGTLLG
jgi:methionyl-tRNA formyltransferase